MEEIEMLIELLKQKMHAKSPIVKPSNTQTQLPDLAIKYNVS